MLTIQQFTVEGLTQGCITDRDHPLFTWYAASDKNHTEVTHEALTLREEESENKIWRSEGKLDNAAAYEGNGLRPLTRYVAELCVKDNHGEQARSTVHFMTGRRDLPWTGHWITDPTYSFTDKHGSPEPMVFRTTVRKEAGKELRSALLFATAMGIYNAYLDGKKIGDVYFAPGFTSYSHEMQYQVYDLTKDLQDGQSHALTFTVAGGWAVGRYTYKSRNRIFADRQALLCELRFQYEDGTEQVLGSDEHFEVTRKGPVRAAEFYDGEVYDAGVDLKEVPWNPAGEEHLRFSPKLTASYGAPVKAHEELWPVSVTRSPSGVLIYDFGQNFAGVIRATLRNTKKGQRIVFTHAEILKDGELFVKPLRSAKQEAVYIAAGSKEESYSPSLTYMGFRYVGVEGIKEEDLSLSAVALYSDIEAHGGFSCSNEALNRLQQNILWSTKSNFMDIPTDCPQRDERMGWTGDIALFSPVAVWNFDTRRFLYKWLKDVKYDQGRGGGVPMIVPNVKVYWQWELVITMAVDHWGDACILVPWALYKNTGDTRILDAMYPVMTKYLKACRFWAGLFSVGDHRYVWQLLHHYGDWLAPGVDMWTWMKRGKYTATACLSHSAGILAEIAQILGKDEDARNYRDLQKNTARAYRELLMDSDCRLKAKEEFQTGYVLPLYYGLLSGEDAKKAADHLAELVRKNDYHIGTGFPGTPYVLFALADNGHEEEAFRMLEQDTCPSWLYEVKQGGTTIWERWDAIREDGTCNTGDDDGTGGMLSFNHYASGAVGDFLYRRIAGIEATSAGYRCFEVKPLIGGGITSAKAHVTTRYGVIESRWEIREEAGNRRFHIRVEVPVGSVCTLILPDGERCELDAGSYEKDCVLEGENK